MTMPPFGPFGPVEAQLPLLRMLGTEIVTGTDATTLQAALEAFFEGAGEKRLVKLFHVADWEVLIVYAV